MDLQMIAKSLGPLQESLKKAEAERAASSFDGSAGGGSVKIRLSGTLQVQKVTIAPAAAGDAAMLEDLVQAAMNDALRQYRNKFGGTVEEQVGKLLGGGGGLGAMMGPLLATLGRK